MLKIKRGSVFDEKCDLLILPCDSGGGVTSWVLSEIEQNDIPFPSGRVPYGKVRFLEAGSTYEKSDFVGFAASVDVEIVRSSLAAIKTIANDIARYCRDTGCTIINLPLLGTGAGKLHPNDVFDIFEEILAPEIAVFNVFIPEHAIAELFLDREEHQTLEVAANEENPRVFISYSWKDEGVKSWTLELAKRLCENGVDARLDRFHLRPGMDLPQWMTNEVLKASKVLLICDSHYAEKADMRKAGVGWETMIIQGDMMLQGELNAKYIVIAYGDFEKNTPIYMKSKLGISKEDIDKDINKLLEYIFDIDTAPKIGRIPEWVLKKRAAK